MIAKKDLRHLRDDKTVLSNPHKGWYWHYVDNGLRNPKYRDRVKSGSDYHDFPGLNHLYLRFDWSDIQPEPDVFDWSQLDDIMDEWGTKGYRFALRACCSETADFMPFATPKWLHDMGCGGAFYPPYPEKDPQWWKKTHFEPSRKAPILANPEKYCEMYWEPDYYDPLFLEYLEKFIRAYAEKYDNDPRIEYVDLGSYGCWGEGHTSCGSMRTGFFDMHRKHAYLHAKYFKKKPILMNDDFVNQIEGNSREHIISDTKLKTDVRDYCLSLGMGIRDDSILAGPDKYERDYHTVSTPELFDQFYMQAPVDVEGGHITTYSFEDGKGGFRFLDAARRTHATYAGFHGYIEEWLEKNYFLTEYLANRLGYWYFINSISHNNCTDSGVKLRVDMEWENKGYGLCYTPYALEFRFSNSRASYQCLACDFDNMAFMSESVTPVPVWVELPGGMPAGVYDVSVRVVEGDLPIKLGIKAEYMDSDGFYKLSQITILEYTSQRMEEEP